MESLLSKESLNSDATINNEALDETFDDAAIAIVGMACHLPGALNISEYWSNLKNGVESVQFYTDKELLEAGESAVNLANPNYVRAQPYLKNYNRFDAGFWGFNPQDAAVTDPAHRLFLEVAYQALEHAGHTGYDNEGRVAVFASSGENLYRLKNLQSNSQLMDDMGEFLVRHTGNCMNFLATRLSYELDLRGPSINVQTACSSTLVGVHMAVQSLLGGECDTAIVGGSTVVTPQQRGYIYREGEILSPDGHCRPFDAHSQGTVFGSGAGAIVLKRYEDAVADGDTVYGVVCGTAINNDGAQKIGYLAPGVDGQAAAVAEALSISGVDASDITYIEAHGTGTPVGDPIEFEALNQVYREATDKRDYCHVGSVKSNIGHLGEAAGIASIIKVALALQHKKIPPTLNYQSPNSDIDLDNSPFLINNQLVDWPSTQLRKAGITALGAGGTNAHVIVSEPPALATSLPSSHTQQLLVLSAKTPTALNAASHNLAKALQQDNLNLADVAFTLQRGRRAYPYRRAIAVEHRDDAIALLEGQDAKRVVDSHAENRSPSLVFMFPGGGAQYAGMGAGLYHSEAVYHQAFDSCLDCLDGARASQIRDLVFASSDNLDNASKLLERPSSALPALFATEYALAKQLIAWGAKPQAFIGHSMGEYTAACLAGVLQLNDAMRLVALRGELFEQVALGGMLSVALAEADVRKHLSDELDIAAVNADDLCVVSGPIKAIERLHSDLDKQEIDCTRIRINVAAHSSMLDSILEPFRTFCQSITFSKPTIPFTSNVSGGWISDTQAMDPNYWVDHLRSTVRFSKNIATVLADDTRVLVEVGPGRTLTTLSQAGEARAQASFNSMRHPKEPCSDVEYALRTYGHIWAAGVTTNWSDLWGDERRQRIALPSYPFERKTYWIDPVVNAQAQPSINDEKIEKRPNIDDWFSRISWTQSPTPQSLTSKEIDAPAVDKKAPVWLVFTDSCGVSNHMVDQLTGSDQIITVQKGDAFKQHTDSAFSISENNLADFEQLFQALSKSQQLPRHIVFLWPVTHGDLQNSLEEKNDRFNDRLKNYDTNMQSCFWGLFNLSKVLCEYETPMRLTVVSDDMQSIVMPSIPEKSLLIGPISVLPHEMPHIETQSIDISLLHISADGLKKVAKQIIHEIGSANDERMVAYRGNDRWIRTIKDAPIKEMNHLEPEWLRPGGTYLITGGLGGIGLTIAKHLAELGAGHLVLLGRRSLPEKSSWKSWLAQHADNDATSQRIQKVQAIESCGAKVISIAANVVDHKSMAQAVSDATAECGSIHGVIHAAGTMDDQLIMLKSRASAEAVIDAKVKGALILDNIFSTQSLDFFIVFSSIASYLGLPGQIDYTAANAFLDAFAIERSQRASGKSLVINWNAWRDIGMVVDGQHASSGGKSANDEIYRVKHPALDCCVEQSHNDKPQFLFSTHFSVNKHWLLSEHRTKTGIALIPGTGMVELLRAAYTEHCARLSAEHKKPPVTAIALTDIQFMSAFQLNKNDGHDCDRDLHIRVEGDEKQASLIVYSDSDEIPHAIGHAKTLSQLPPQQENKDIAIIRDRCAAVLETDGQYLAQSFMDFGPRWGCVERIQYGEAESLLTIELPEQFLADLEDYLIHPSLLDIAIGGSQMLIEGFDKHGEFYVPIAYEKFEFFDVMPSRFFSHVRYDSASPVGFARFDASLMDADGKVFAEIKGFTMKQVGADFASTSESNVDLTAKKGMPSAADNLEAILREAITPEEGLEAFNRVMAKDAQAQWIVSSVNSAQWLQQLEKNDSPQQNQSGIQYLIEDEHDADADKDIETIEQALLKHEAIEAMIVRSFMDENDERRLIAYYLPDYDHSMTVSELRRYAKACLANDCIPQQFIELDELPKNAEGQIDRAELKDPFAPEDTHVEPETETEKVLASIWQEILGIKKVGLSDNFFDIGGHSLLAIRVVIRVDKHFGIKLDQSVMIMNTLEKIAMDIDKQLGVTMGESEKSLIEIESEIKETKKPFFKSLFSKGESK